MTLEFGILFGVGILSIIFITIGLSGIDEEHVSGYLFPAGFLLLIVVGITSLFAHNDVEEERIRNESVGAAVG